MYKKDDRGMKNVARVAVVLMLLLAIFGCKQEDARVRKDEGFQKWQARAESSKGYAPIAKKHTARLKEKISGQQIGETEKPLERQKKLPTRKITMRMQDTGVDAILRALARAVNINILINEKVGGTATVNVTDADWDQLFNGILRSHGLTYTWEGDILRVMTMEDMERDLKRATQKRDIRLAAPMTTRIVSINYADEKKLKESLEQFLSITKDGKKIGSVMVDEHTKALIVKALPEDMERLMRMIDALDRPTPQVLIEAHIVEANRTVARQLGIQWGGLAARREGANQYLTAGSNSSGTIGNPLSPEIEPTSGMMANFPATLADGQGFTIGYISETVGGNILSVQLSALEEDGYLNILSSPSISTLDNQFAVIESGATVPFQTVSKEGNINIEWKDAVLRLEVQPHVIDEETIKMLIKTRKDELDFSNEVAGNPTIITKKAETRVILQDGQTTVIGGLNKETKNNSDSGVPYLMEIPLLGYLFKGIAKSDAKEDLLIFITPHVLKERPAAVMPEDLGSVKESDPEQSGEIVE